MKLLRHGLMLLALLCVAPLAWAVIPPVTNFGKVTVSTGYSSVATSVVLLSGHGVKLPGTFPFPLVWWNCSDYGAPEDDSAVEIVSVTARTTDTLTVIRAHDGTSAQNHNTGGKTYCMVLAMTKGIVDAIRTDIAAAGGSASKIKSGTSNPEGAITGNVGDLFLRTDAHAGVNVLYQKVSGTGNTGWASMNDLASSGQIGNVAPNVGRFTYLEGVRILGGFPWPTYGPSVAIDASAGNAAQIIVTNASAFTIEAPASPVYGQWLTIIVKNTSGGIIATPTWAAVYKMVSFIKPANGFRRSVTFLYDATNWVEINCSPEVPN